MSNTRFITLSLDSSRLKKQKKKLAQLLLYFMVDIIIPTYYYCIIDSGPDPQAAAVKTRMGHILI